MMKILSVKSIPKLSWSSPQALTLQPKFPSMLFLFMGLIIFGLGEAILIASSVGVSPWTVLAQGIAENIGWSIGLTTFVISICVLSLWIPLKQKPGIGTISNAFIIAVTLDYALPHLPTFEGFLFNTLMAATGVLITGIGGAIYLVANLGPGPRDGLMTGLQSITGWPIAIVRTMIEISVIFLGWFLGGTLGIGTVLYAFGIGPSVAVGVLGLLMIFKPFSEKM